MSYSLLVSDAVAIDRAIIAMRRHQRALIERYHDCPPSLAKLSLSATIMAVDREITKAWMTRQIALGDASL